MSRPTPRSTLFPYTTLFRSWRGTHPARSPPRLPWLVLAPPQDRKSTRLNSSHVEISYAVFCMKKKYCITQVKSGVKGMLVADRADSKLDTPALSDSRRAADV